MAARKRKPKPKTKAKPKAKRKAAPKKAAKPKAKRIPKPKIKAKPIIDVSKRDLKKTALGRRILELAERGNLSDLALIQDTLLDKFKGSIGAS